MNQKIDQASDELYDLELMISKFLRVGVMLAGVLLFVGWALQYDSSSDPFRQFKTYHALSLHDSLAQAFAIKDMGMLIGYSGLFVLISLPVLRVFLTAVLFVRQREYVLALVAAVVLIALGTSMFLGIEL